MRKSFYQYLMKYRETPAKDDLSHFANEVFNDHGFPKLSEEYDELSTYLEMNGHYLKSMSTFDESWELYKQDESD
ncbi:uncharacterized protein YozE (UPF0346 family) [Oikeobacillus pervagus]|uniref:UPF0346 protein J2S13_000823 n=1 Tax=Oikeobacillus pervagus TaxID=1325931 RepID=A0AAJ1WFX2_9BACI|nr:YozE family protein [Oikeobacillus pervagus]MDQ0214427.1 uncharacterized protein YozE (UPF0346 family) [Oikeobacillus pervagus]